MSCSHADSTRASRSTASASRRRSSSARPSWIVSSTSLARPSPRWFPPTRRRREGCAPASLATMNFRFTYQATVELDEGDVRAIGAAVTVALCGHWEHEGPCRWPHLTTTESTQGRIAVHVSYDCADKE